MLGGTIDKTGKGKTISIRVEHLKHFKLPIREEEAFSLVLIRKGSVDLRIDGTLFCFTAPCVICFNERRHLVLAEDRVTDAKFLTFDPALVHDSCQIDAIREVEGDVFCERHALLQLSPFLTCEICKAYFVLTAEQLRHFDGAYNQLHHVLCTQKDWFWPYLARTYLLCIIGLLETFFYSRFTGKSEEGECEAIPAEFREILDYIETHIHATITLDSLYRRFRMNKNAIENLFKQYLDTTCYSYIATKRYEQATQYLQRTNLRGKQIAEHIGLSSSQNFCAFFKKMHGVTPNQYRKEFLMKSQARHTGVSD